MSLKAGYCTIIDRLYEVEPKLNCPPGLHTKHLNLNQNGNTDFKILSALRDMSIKRLDGLKNSLLKCLSMWGINTVLWVKLLPAEPEKMWEISETLIS